MEPRAVVRWFSEIMEQKLRKNDHKGGWDDEDVSWLFRRAEKELRELRQVLLAKIKQDSVSIADCTDCNAPDIGYEKKIIFEAADAANFVMMIADRISSRSCNYLIKFGTCPKCGEATLYCTCH